ncbi:MAG: tetratricopeptide repeat protein [Saprospiraceae bacterium]|nr:tetratricopeptide repeat protein [Saprospiraceae bacterium]
MRPVSFAFFLFLPLSAFCQSTDSLTVRRELDSLKNLGNQFLDEEKWDDAAVILHAEEVCRGAFGEESVPFAEWLNLEARLYLNKGDLQNTTDRSQRSQLILKRAGKTTHPVYMMNLLFLIEVAYTVGDYQDAQDLLEETLPLAAKQWGDNHIQYLQYKMNLGILYRINKQLDRSEEVLVEVIEGIDQAMGQENEFYVGCLVNLGLLYSDIGDVERCERAYLQAKDYYEHILKSTENSTYLAILQNLGIHYWELKAYEQVEPLYRESLPIMKTLFGSENPDYAGGLINLGLLYLDMHKYEKAEPPPSGSQINL